jgi:hypothetical protein
MNGIKNIFDTIFDTESKSIFCLYSLDLSFSKKLIPANFFQHPEFQIHNVNLLKLSNLKYLLRFEGVNK